LLKTTLPNAIPMLGQVKDVGDNGKVINIA